jgi:hypothetical protein
MQDLRRRDHEVKEVMAVLADRQLNVWQMRHSILYVLVWRVDPSGKQ